MDSIKYTNPFDITPSDGNTAITTVDSIASFTTVLLSIVVTQVSVMDG